MLSKSEPIRIAEINNGIRFMAGYHTGVGDDRFQHVVAAANDGYVYHVIWDPDELAPGYLPYAGTRIDTRYNGMNTIAGFFTPDDGYYHVVVGTSDCHLYELYYTLGGTPIRPGIRDLTKEYPLSSFDARKGMASFYSPGNGLPHCYRHVVIVNGDGNPVDVTWNAYGKAKGNTITVPPTSSQIASISGFLSTDDSYRHIIVAQNDTGQIYDIDYPGSAPGDIRSQDDIYKKTSFQEQVKNVTAFCSSDDRNRRHIVVLTGANELKLRAYDKQGGYMIKDTLAKDDKLAATPTSDQDKVADITSFYNAHDGKCHVLYATKVGNLYEIIYPIE